MDINERYSTKIWNQSEIPEETMKNELDLGKVIICSMKQGDFTVAGHFIVINGSDEYGFMVIQTVLQEVGKDGTMIKQGTRSKTSGVSQDRQIKN